jgi:hypothetical protein
MTLEVEVPKLFILVYYKTCFCIRVTGTYVSRGLAVLPFISRFQLITQNHHRAISAADTATRTITSSRNTVLVLKQAS